MYLNIVLIQIHSHILLYHFNCLTGYQAFKQITFQQLKPSLVSPSQYMYVCIHKKAVYFTCIKCRYILLYINYIQTMF